MACCLTVGIICSILNVINHAYAATSHAQRDPFESHNLVVAIVVPAVDPLGRQLTQPQEFPPPHREVAGHPMWVAACVAVLLGCEPDAELGHDPETVHEVGCQRDSEQLEPEYRHRTVLRPQAVRSPGQEQVALPEQAAVSTAPGYMPDVH